MTDREGLAEASPTLVEAILRCGFAVHLSRQHRSRTGGGAPSNPYARLGNAVHRVLGWAAGTDLSGINPDDLEAATRSKWREEVAVEAGAASQFAVERYFGPPERWPGYASMEERLLIEVERVLDEGAAGCDMERWVERPLTLESPPLRGSPDLVTVDGASASVVDYKSGRVGPDDVTPTGRYGRQVLLYAAMVRQLGKVVARATLRPIGRAPFEVEVTEATIDRACEDASTALSTYNLAIAEGNPSQLAHPSDHACGLCPHVLYCSALWTEGRAAELDEFQVLQATVGRIQRSAVGSVAVELNATLGTTVGGVMLAGLDPRRVPAIDGISAGDEVRISGVHIRSRSDGLPAARPGPWVQLQRVAALDGSDD